MSHYDPEYNKLYHRESRKFFKAHGLRQVCGQKECPLCYSDKQRHHTPQNDPLTIEELREMDGEPVYIISEFYHISEWNIPKGVGEIVIAYDVPCAGMKSVIPSVEFIDGKNLSVGKYGSDWCAYRRPPEGEEA